MDVQIRITDKPKAEQQGIKRLKTIPTTTPPVPIARRTYKSSMPVRASNVVSVSESTNRTKKQARKIKRVTRRKKITSGVKRISRKKGVKIAAGVLMPSVGAFMVGRTIATKIRAKRIAKGKTPIFKRKSKPQIPIKRAFSVAKNIRAKRVAKGKKPVFKRRRRR